MTTKKEKTKHRVYNWKELCDRAEGVEEPIKVYNFPQKTLYENPYRPYGPKK
jgi:hypothetical protein|tara:strand:+ start:498 stop:653 length:156 start_codon:yes stop_codon:yes gene_type:complete